MPNWTCGNGGATMNPVLLDSSTRPNMAAAVIGRRSAANKLLLPIKFVARLVLWPCTLLLRPLKNYAYESTFIRQLMHVRLVVFWVTYLRYLYFVRLCGRLRFLDQTPFASEN